MTEALLFQKRPGLEADCRWSVVGDHGGVSATYWPAVGDRAEMLSMLVHSREPLANLPVAPEPWCSLIKAPCHTTSVFDGGELLAQWEASGCDDEVIQAALESRYAFQFERGGVVSR